MLEDDIKQQAKERGAKAVGLAGIERLGTVPSMDATYVMPEARSIVSFMIPFDAQAIRGYLAKTDRRAMQSEETRVYRQLDHVGRAVAHVLRAAGHHAVVVEVNLDYRFKNSRSYQRLPYGLKQGVVDWLAAPSGPVAARVKRALTPALYDHGLGQLDWNLTPSFSHRYGAVAAGTGALGWSGNVLHPDHGAQVLYGTVITDARLASDPMLEGPGPCDRCRSCTKVCQSDFIAKKREASVTIGGRRFVHAAKAHNLRCILVCAGFSGQSKHPGWSTWSPGRFDLPESDADLDGFWRQLVLDNLWRHNHTAKVLGDLLFHTHHGPVHKPRERFAMTCGNCQLVCAATRQERKANVALLRGGGEVVEGPGFSRRVVRKAPATDSRC